MYWYAAVYFTDVQPELWQQWEQAVVRPGFDVTMFVGERDLEADSQ